MQIQTEVNRAQFAYFKAIGAIVWKDLVAELRSRELLAAMLVFALLVILIFNFAIELQPSLRASIKVSEAAIEQSKLQLEYSVIKAPFAGRVGAVLVNVGNVIKANDDRQLKEMADKGELSVLDEQVVKSLKEQELLSRNINVEYDRQRSLGEIMADRLADFGGSWLFIGIFCGILLIWIVMNSVVMLMKPFDPYPYIFLNLILSCLAAMQAPVILMSENRQAARDRMQAEQDYRINLKAELEIRHLHEKIDHLLMNQWQRLMEIQQIQMELMQELAHKKRRERTD